jgi:hypothetical protein
LSPMWTSHRRRKVRLWPSEQITLILKDIHGGMKGYAGYIQKMRKVHGDRWANDSMARLKALHNFEVDNRVHFIVRGSEIVEWRPRTWTKPKKGEFRA